MLAIKCCAGVTSLQAEKEARLTVDSAKRECESQLACGNFDIIWAVSHAFLNAVPPPTRAVCDALRRAHACWMLIGACDPMA